MDCMKQWHSRRVLDVVNALTRRTGWVAVGSRRMMAWKTGAHMSPGGARLPWLWSFPLQSNHGAGTETCPLGTGVCRHLAALHPLPGRVSLVRPQGTEQYRHVDKECPL
jgi:hypothetical protein